MHTNVVMAARDAAIRAGFSTLRYNFRGVGRSEGFHDHGRGERDDLQAALAAAGAQPILMAYSFGAWVAAGILPQKPLPAILIAPPTGMMPFPSLQGLDIWALVGAHDQFCDQKILREAMAPERIHVIPGIDHFWFGRETELENCLAPSYRARRAIIP
jgi:alpha/beta superfamily hydrolase